MEWLLMTGVEVEIWGPIVAGSGGVLTLAGQKLIAYVTARLRDQPTTAAEFKAQLDREAEEQRKADERAKALFREVLAEYLTPPVDPSASQQDLSAPMTEATALMIARGLQKINDRAEKSEGA